MNSIIAGTEELNF
jgi:hypothetical protein